MSATKTFINMYVNEGCSLCGMFSTVFSWAKAVSWMRLMRTYNPLAYTVSRA